IGTVASVPRLMKGQGSIIATGAIRTIGGAKVMTITSTYDHRIIQGAESGNFLRRLDGLLQGDDKFYDEVFGSLRVPGGGMRDAGGVVVAELTHPPSRISHPDDLRHVAAAMALVKAIRNFGHLAARLETLERFLHKAYLGQKRFSIEGLDALVPMLDQTVELAGTSGARRVVLGMAHRGRLNVLAHIVGLPYETIFAEFEGGRHVEGTLTPEGGTGD